MATPESKRKTRAVLKMAVYALLFDGVPYRRISAQLGVNAGTVSRWKRSDEYSSYASARYQEAGEPLPEELKERIKPPDYTYTTARKRETFLQALSVGAVQYARMYARCSDQEARAFLLEMDTAHALAKPRIAVLGMLLKAALNDNEQITSRIKAATEWWRLANGETQSPLIHIDATSGSAEETQTPTQILLENMKSIFLEAGDLDLMGNPESEIDDDADTIDGD